MRCTPVSSGCANCWHLAVAKRLAKNPSIPKKHRIAYEGGLPVLDPKELEAPLHLRGPARIGVMLMGDLFHESIPDEWIFDLLGIMAVAHKHIFVVLTKRSDRMRAFFKSKFVWALIEGSAQKTYHQKTDEDPSFWLAVHDLPNVIGMVTVENQEQADKRIPDLLATPWSKRGVSIEPMLEPIKIPGKILCPCSCFAGNPRRPHPDCENKPSIDWVIVGGETGPHARPLHPDWIRSIIQQSKSAGVPVFVKQLSGKNAKNMDKWPEDLRVREIPNAI